MLVARAYKYHLPGRATLSLAPSIPRYDPAEDGSRSRVTIEFSPLLIDFDWIEEPISVCECFRMIGHVIITCSGSSRGLAATLPDCLVDILSTKVSVDNLKEARKSAHCFIRKRSYSMHTIVCFLKYLPTSQPPPPINCEAGIPQVLGSGVPLAMSLGTWPRGHQ